MRHTGLVLLTLVACSSVSRERDDSAPAVERSQLNFGDEQEARRFDDATACFSAQTGWQHRPLTVGGNFIRAQWCTWEGPCSAPREQEKVGSRWASVGTLHYPDASATALDTFGVQISTGRRVAQGWSVSVSASSNGKRILGDHAFVTFQQHGDIAPKMTIGLSYTWKIAEQDFSHWVKMDPWAWLDRARTSPEALRDDAVQGWTALHTKVVTALEAGEVRKCVYGPYEGDGIPPECVEQVPLSAEEVALELDRIDARLKSVKTAFAEPGPLHAALLEVAPADCF